MADGGGPDRDGARRPEPAVYDELQRANRRATRLLLGATVFLALVLVWILVGWFAPQAALDPVTAVPITAGGALLGVGGTYLAYRGGPAIALRAAKARPAPREQYPQLHNVFDEVCVSAGIANTRPKLYVVDDPAPNAFATGLRLEDSHVAVTTGLVERLPRYELRAVLAHEVAHIVNDDIRAVTVAVATAGLVALLADVLVRAMWFGGRGGRGGNRGGNSAGAAQVVFLVLGLLAVVLAPIAAQLIRFAVSRQREYLADATAADLLRDPQSMVNALRRLDADRTEIRQFEVATAHLWFEEPNDTKGKDRGAKMARRFATHPSIGERIERLARLNAGTVRLDDPLPPPPQSPGPSAPPPSSGPRGGSDALDPLRFPGTGGRHPGSPGASGPPPPPRS
ncbi:M48 family metallopeptidase [Egicoccus halophilus]|uniref:Protease HtpX homolog n=1 Tax=Egicoccus halophilus TaxID=1670830 RepID=A0A8J3ERY4_9ACTN|nr:M48 family metallopeptidase [Egicoccus halophilus]GGI06009.1 protease HtpX [Egicoccus halophilus]